MTKSKYVNMEQDIPKAEMDTIFKAGIILIQQNKISLREFLEQAKVNKTFKKTLVATMVVKGIEDAVKKYEAEAEKKPRRKEERRKS